MTYSSFKECVVNKNKYTSEQDFNKFTFKFVLLVLMCIVCSSIMGYICTAGFYPIVFIFGVLFLVLTSVLCEYMCDSLENYTRVVGIINRHYIIISVLVVLLTLIVYILL